MRFPPYWLLCRRALWQKSVGHVTNLSGTAGNLPGAMSTRLIGAGAAVAMAIATGGAQSAVSTRAADTPFPPIAAKKTSCPKVVYTIDRNYTVHVVIAAEKGHHPSAALLTCKSAYAIALAGKKDYSKFPLDTGKKIVVAGATYTQAVGGPDVWPPTSGPVWGWFGNGVEVLLMIPSGS
jgi:hypothetical protein